MCNWIKPLAIIGLLCLTAGPVHAQRTATEKLIPGPSQLSPFGLERAWLGQATLNPSRDKVRHVTIDEDAVYVLSTSGVVTAFDSESGQRLWALQLGQFDQPGFPSTSNETLAMFVIGSTLYGIEKRTGRIEWSIVLPGQPSTGPSADDKQVYVGTLDGTVYALSTRKIRDLFNSQRLPQWGYEAIVWQFKAVKEVTSPPVPIGSSVHFASRDGSVYAVSTSERKLNFQVETDAPIVAPLVRSDTTLFMASEDFSFYSINGSKRGTINWEFTSGLPIRKAPFCVGTDLYIMPDRGGMHCLNAKTGARRWWQSSLSSVVGLIGNSVFCIDQDGSLVQVSRESGAIGHSLPLRSFAVRVVNDRTDRLYFATENGMVICLRQKGEQLPTYHKYPDRLPILPEVTPEPGEEPKDEAKPEPAAAASTNN